MNRTNVSSQPPPSHRFDAPMPSSASQIHNHLHQKGVMLTPYKPIDPSRAPKTAVVLFTVFILFAVTYHTIYGLQLDAMQNSKSSSSTHSAMKIQYLNRTIQETQRLNTLIEEVSRPNLDQEHNPIILPPELSNLADITVPINRNKDIPFYWHVPRSGGSLIKNAAAYCLDLVQASNMGNAIDTQGADLPELSTVVDTQTGAKFLNIDTASPEGLELAKYKGSLVGAYPGLGVIISPYLFHGSMNLLNEEHKGRMFVMMRHPIHRAESMFWHLRSRPDTGPMVGDSLLLFAKGPVIENNWMTRFLSNKMGGELTTDDEAVAREVLRTKALVGLVKRKNESYQRFKDYFGWKINDANPQKTECEEKYLEWGWLKSDYHPVGPNSEEWKALKMSNTFDLRLYEYAEKLFEAQGALLAVDGRVGYVEPDPTFVLDQGNANPEDVEMPAFGESSESNVIDLISSNFINNINN